jgi:predicted RNA-binding Zn ribbon-like protein
MSAGVNATPSSDELAFRFVSGHRALDFLATLGDRHRSGVERLRRPADLDRWLVAASLPGRTHASAQDLDDARALREAINRVTRASMHHATAEPSDLAALNHWAIRPQPSPQLDRNFRRHWAPADPVAGTLALIAREAVELLSGSDRELLRECAAAPACSLLYLDRSRGRRRRWCEMQRCGSRAKMADYRQRKTGRIRTDTPDEEQKAAAPPASHLSR